MLLSASIISRVKRFIVVGVVFGCGANNEATESHVATGVSTFESSLAQLAAIHDRERD